ncbi:MAG: methyltransferase [Verrucomicrobiota bacterium]
MNIAELMDVATGYWKSAVLISAIEVGVFEVLADGPATAEEIAGKRSTAPVQTEELLNALAGLGILDKTGDRFSVVPSLADTLNPSRSGNLIPALRFNADTYPIWGGLTQCVREGGPVVPTKAHLGDDPGRTWRFVEAMHSRAALFGPALAEGIGLNGSTRLLDVAAGPGTLSRCLAEKNPGLNVTLFDLPPILDAARRIQEESAAFDRLAFHPGDYHTDELPGGFDSVLYSGALHQESRDFARTLMSKIFNALEPGGAFYLVDFMVDESRTQPAFSVLFSLNMMLTRESGRVYTREQAQELMAEAGFHNMESRSVGQAPYVVIEAQKPNE